jgi:hypothetical protein
MSFSERRHYGDPSRGVRGLLFPGLPLLLSGLALLFGLPFLFALPLLALQGCRLFETDIPLSLELPELPAHWQECCPDLAWLIVVPGTETSLQIPSGQVGSPCVGVPKTQHQPVLAFPTVAGGRCCLCPAAAVFPLDLSADGRTLSLRWEQGPVGKALQRLVAQGVDVEILNVPRLCREIDERFPEDPWTLDLDLAADCLARESFRVTDLRSRTCRAVHLQVGPGLWFLESPFFVPVAVPEGQGPASGQASLTPELLLPAVALGFHHLLEAEAGWVADLWVGEQQTLWLPAP